MALGLLSAPAVPAVGSANQVVNNTGMPVLIFVAQTAAAATGVGIGEAGATLTANCFTTTAAASITSVLLMPGQAIAVFTTAPTSWTWFGLN